MRSVGTAWLSEVHIIIPKISVLKTKGTFDYCLYPAEEYRYLFAYKRHIWSTACPSLLHYNAPCDCGKAHTPEISFPLLHVDELERFTMFDVAYKIPKECDHH
jgi:hypothetical protein